MNFGDENEKSCAKNFCRKLLSELIRNLIQKFSVERLVLKVAGTEQAEKKISVAVNVNTDLWEEDEDEYRLYGDTGI